MRHGNSFKIGQMPFRCMQPVPVQGGLAGLPNLSVPPPFGEVEPPVLLLCCALSFPVPSATHIEKFKWAPTFPGASFLLHPQPHSSCGLGIPSHPHCQGLPFLPCVWPPSLLLRLVTACCFLCWGARPCHLGLGHLPAAVSLPHAPGWVSEPGARTPPLATEVLEPMALSLRCLLLLLL